MILDQENIITIVVSDVRALQQYDMKNKVESNWMIIRRNVTNQAQSKRGIDFKFRRTAIFDKPRFRFCKNFCLFKTHSQGYKREQAVV